MTIGRKEEWDAKKKEGKLSETYTMTGPSGRKYYFFCFVIMSISRKPFLNINHDIVERQNHTGKAPDRLFFGQLVLWIDIFLHRTNIWTLLILHKLNCF
jgi:hypothetical protein